jgi:hypothetical protein
MKARWLIDLQAELLAEAAEEKREAAVLVKQAEAARIKRYERWYNSRRAKWGRRKWWLGGGVATK